MSAKMKILFIAPFGVRPKGTVIARMLPLAVELQQLGHCVTIVAPPYTNPEDSGKVELLRGVRLVNVVLPKAGKVLGTLLLTWRMFRAVLAEKPDLVHLFKPKGYGGLAAMLLHALKKTGFRLPPLFVDSDDWEGKGGMNDLLDYSMAERLLFAFQEKWLLRSAAGITVASRELEKLALELGVARERIQYLPNCIEPQRSGDGALMRRRLNINSTTPVVLLYTRFFEFSQERLYSLFKLIYRQRADVCFLVIGKGRNSEEERLKADALENGYHAALVIAGWVEPDDLPDYLAVADIAIYPMDDNLINRAKCPAKLTELLRAGVPVVADAVGQAKEYVRGGATGILTDPADYRGMAEGVVALLADSDRRLAVGSAGRQYISEFYAWPAWAARLDDFYAKRSTSET